MNRVLLNIAAILALSAVMQPVSAVSFSPVGYEGDIRNLWASLQNNQPVAPAPGTAAVGAKTAEGLAQVDDCGNQLSGEQKKNIDEEGNQNGNLNKDNSDVLECLTKYAKYEFKSGLTLPKWPDIMPSVPLPSVSALLNIKDMVCSFEQQQMSKAMQPLSGKLPNMKLPQNGAGGTGGVNTTLGGQAPKAVAPNQSTGTGTNPIK